MAEDTPPRRKLEELLIYSNKIGPDGAKAIAAFCAVESFRVLGEEDFRAAAVAFCRRVVTPPESFGAIGEVFLGEAVLVVGGRLGGNF